MRIADTTDTPRGRKRIVPHPSLVAALENSARTGTSKTLVCTPAAAAELRRQLRGTTVRERWLVYSRIRSGPRPGSVRLIFTAYRKHKEQHDDSNR